MKLQVYLTPLHLQFHYSQVSFINKITPFIFLFLKTFLVSPNCIINEQENVSFNPIYRGLPLFLAIRKLIILTPRTCSLSLRDYVSLTDQSRSILFLCKSLPNSSFVLPKDSLSRLFTML